MEESAKTSVFGNSLIWFGAAVSIAEILTGALFAPLGFARGMAAIILGHVLGCFLLYCAGLIGARSRKSAMESVKSTYGSRGGLLFAVLNVLQLLGWTGVMIASGAQAAHCVHGFSCGAWPWMLIIGGLIQLWVLAGGATLQKVNMLTMLLLFALSLLLSRLVFRDAVQPATGELSFGEALELSIAMPVSWLPLIGDYTCNARRPRLSSAVSAAVYFIGSCWMYAIGMAAAIYAEESDVALIMGKSGFGIPALLIVTLSTVTTTFLDVYSAGISAESIHKTLSRKKMAALSCGIGVLLAIFCNTSSFESFLYWIGSVFVPMATVQILDTLVFHREEDDSRHTPRNLVLWFIGFLLYRLFLHWNLPIGSTIPDIAATAAVCCIASRIRKIGFFVDL